MHTETKQEKDKGACAWHMLMTSQRTKEGDTGMYKRGFLGIMREVQLGITPARQTFVSLFIKTLHDQPFCRIHPAKELLEKDILNNLHEFMTPNIYK